jgi:hypothetical protein
MRSVRSIGLIIAFCVALAFVFGCNSVQPTVTRAPASVLSANASLFLRTNLQQVRIAQSLRNNGLTETDSYRAADYVFDVRVGRSKGSSRCGSIRNVAYQLKSADGLAMVIKEFGRTGECTGNIFDAMSHKLASYLGG